MQQTPENFHAYLDESENITAGQYVTGGFIARADVWREIEKKWSELLPRRVECFHATDCFSGNEAFKNIEIPERVALLDRLIDLIASSELWLIAYGLDQVTYRKIAPKRIRNNFLDNRYAAPLGGVVERACTYMGNVPSPETMWDVLENGENWEKCAFFIERHEEYAESARHMIQGMRVDPHLWFRWRIGTDHYGTKNGENAIPLLQVADLGVFLAAKRLANSPDGKIAWSGYFEKLQKARRVAPIHWADKTSLEKFAEMNVKPTRK
jgi:hypothetical protein